MDGLRRYIESFLPGCTLCLVTNSPVLRLHWQCCGKDSEPCHWSSRTADLWDTPLWLSSRHWLPHYPHIELNGYTLSPQYVKNQTNAQLNWSDKLSYQIQLHLYKDNEGVTWPVISPSSDAILSHHRHSFSIFTVFWNGHN